MSYDQLHHFIGAGVWDRASLEPALTEAPHEPLSSMIEDSRPNNGLTMTPERERIREVKNV